MSKVTVLKTAQSQLDPQDSSFELTSENPNPSGVGGRLRAARLKSGKTLVQISNLLKIRQTHLTAIEKENFEALPGGAYTVGFIRSYADAVGENGEEIVAILKERQAVSTDIKLPTYERIETDLLPSTSSIFFGIFLLVILVAVWIAYDANVSDTPEENQAETTSAEMKQEETSAQEKAKLQEAIEQMKAQEQELSKPSVESVDDILAAMTKETSVESPSEMAVDLPITLIAREDVWLSIYNENTPNTAVLNTVLKKNSTYNVPNEKGLLINVGRPHVLAMTIGEKEYPVTGPEWGGVIKNLPLNSHYLVHTFYGQKVNEESYGRWVKKNQ